MAAVSAVRRRAGGVRTGHAGTLDPLATGVLVIALGQATRFLNTLLTVDKRYRTEIDLSAFTTTDDLEGARTEIEAAQPPSRQSLAETLAHFTGTIEQRPPAFSAMKIGGRRAYKLARQGQAVEIPARRVTVHSIEIIEWSWPLLTLDIHCAKGFYVRSLARDLGRDLGTGGHCASIRRTAVGPFTLDMARRLDDLPPIIDQSMLIGVEDAKARLP